jgi:hypothetical protein
MLNRNIVAGTFCSSKTKRIDELIMIFHIAKSVEHEPFIRSVTTLIMFAEITGISQSGDACKK